MFVDVDYSDLNHNNRRKLINNSLTWVPDSIYETGKVLIISYHIILTIKYFNSEEIK